jgi:hypothetical protein
MRLNRIKEVQSELGFCLAAAQEAMKEQFDRGIKKTPNWQVGKEFWLNSRNISTTRPSPKLAHQWLGPFPISAKLSPSVYKLTFPLSMKAVHPVFHVSILKKGTPEKIKGRRQQQPDPVTVNGEEEWEVDEVLDCRKKRGKKIEYLVSWKGFGP